MDSAVLELSPSARRVLDHAEFTTTVSAMWADDEWEPVYSRRWLRVVGIIVVAALVLPAIWAGLVQLGLL